MKVGVVGKGGVGKTTTSALVAEGFVARGRRVLAIDTDSNPNLGMSLGLSLEETEAIPVLPRMLAVGQGPDMTPQQLLSEYGRQTPAGVRLISAMRVSQAGSGCTCGNHAAVRSLLSTTIEDETDVTIVDMEAGLEHLSRSGGTLAYADVLLVVMEPSRKSVVTAARTKALADELGIPLTMALGNKARSEADVEFFRAQCDEFGVPLAGVLPYTPAVAEADRRGDGLDEADADGLRAEIARVVDMLEGLPAARAGV